jgi:hypothetical protein
VVLKTNIDDLPGCIIEGHKALEDYTNAQKIKFYLDSNSCPMMKYRIACSNYDWLPNQGGGIKLW